MKVGRPAGWRKGFSEMRPQRQLRAHDDEWLLIKKFADEIKHGDREKCVAFLQGLGNRN